MPTVDVKSFENKKVGTIALDDSVFAVPVNIELVRQVINAQRAGARSGNAKTKTRAEVRGTGKKPYRQKGTGNARRGSNKSPLVVGGGTMHGPPPRSYEQATPKKMMAGALRSALSDRIKADRLVVIDEFKLSEIKTQAVTNSLKNFEAGKILLVDEDNRNLELSGRNVKNVKVLRTEGLNVYDVVKHDWIFLSKKSVETVQKRLERGTK